MCLKGILGKKSSQSLFGGFEATPGSAQSFLPGSVLRYSVRAQGPYVVLGGFTGVGHVPG